MGWKTTRRNVQEVIDEDYKDEKWVWDLQEEADPRDPRCSGAPCHGEHTVDQHNCRIANQHALVVKCRVCGIRLLYVPRQGSSGAYRKSTPLAESQKISKEGTDMHGRDHYKEKTEIPKAKAKAKGKGMSGYPTEKEKEPTGRSQTWRTSRRTDPQESSHSWDDHKTPQRSHMPSHDPSETESWEVESETHEEDYPKWDGNPETWEIYQEAVNLHIAVKKSVEETKAPVWDGDPESWDEYQIQVNEWILKTKKRERRSTNSSRMSESSWRE